MKKFNVNCSKKILILLCGILFVSELSSQVNVVEKGEMVSIENHLVSIEFNLKTGYYTGLNKNGNTKCLSECFFQADQISSKDPDLKYTWEQEEINDVFGDGKSLIIRCLSPSLNNILLLISMYSKHSFVSFSVGFENFSENPIQLKNVSPLIGKAFSGNSIGKDYYVLDGNGGGENTSVIDQRIMNCRNNALATFGIMESRKSITLGGLTYNEFEKFIRIRKEKNELHLSMWAYDPVGKRVDPSKTYIPEDKFYIDFITTDPFQSLEMYGFAVKKAQKIRLNYYDFPTVCLWYVGSEEFGGGPEANDSKGAVWEAEQIKKSGFLNYSRAAVRLVPDNYDSNNQQGWWDDEHFQKTKNNCSKELGCYVTPYETTKKWANAVTELGVLPFTYSQTARRSEDYSIKYPNQMLFNKPFANSISREPVHEAWWFGSINPIVWGCDFTDSVFTQHMDNVYLNYKNAGIAGMMFDYPSTAWNYEGGFDDKYATTASVYRKVFSMAYNGLGTDSYINERNLERGSDITLGLVASQRTWGDNDKVNPCMVSRSGLRWYKNRVVVNYDMDAKNPNRILPKNKDGLRSMLTMSYVAGGRFLMGVSFSKLNQEQLHDISRVFPYHVSPQSARPIDAFTGKKFPQVYDFAINPSWHQLTLYNTLYDSDEWERPWFGGSDYSPNGNPIECTISVELSKPQPDGGLGLDALKKYYIYDFWNDTLIGKFEGSSTLVQNLRAGEARMLSVHEVVDNPQFVSTSRHIMQGYLDLIYCKWVEKQRQLKGKSKVVANEPYIVKIACNGKIPIKCGSLQKDINCKINFNKENDMAELVIFSKKNIEAEWFVAF